MMAHCFRCRGDIEDGGFGFCQTCRDENKRSEAEWPEPPKVTDERYKRKVRRVAVDQEAFKKEGVVRPQDSARAD